MSGATLAAFDATFRDLVVTGVTNLTTPPLALPTAQLPCKWVDGLSIEAAPLRAKALSGHRIFRCRVVVAIGPKAQDTHVQRWSDTLAMVDTLETALKGMTNPTSGTVHWILTAFPNLFDWGFAVTADIEAEEWRV